jgi:hypothetical protein
MFKDKTSRNLIKQIYDHWKRKSYLKEDTISDYRADIGFKLTIIRLKQEFGNNIISNKGRELHIYLPLTGSSPSGYFFKACFENVLPKARITFLVTPRSTSFSLANKTIKQEMEHNIKTHLQKSLNVNDKQFLVIDLLGKGTTTNLIRKALSEIRGEKTDICISDIMETHFRDNYKDAKGKYSMSMSEHLKPKITLEGYNREKLDEKIMKYTYYYLGNQYINNSGIMKVIEKELR